MVLSLTRVGWCMLSSVACLVANWLIDRQTHCWVVLTSRPARAFLSLLGVCDVYKRQLEISTIFACNATRDTGPGGALRFY